MGRNGNLKIVWGKKFGNLTVLERAGSDKNGLALWRCQCSCGEICIARGDRLRSGAKKSCAVNGHYWTGWIEERGLNRKEVRRTPEYWSWETMRRRCYNKNHHKYHLYGAQGVSVCERWRTSFKNFLEDMGPKPTSQHTLDRYPEKNGNYEPDNCRWATHAQQNANRQNNIYVEYRGERVLLLDLVKKLGVRRGTVYSRLKMGWPLNEALAMPVRRRTSPTHPIVKNNVFEYRQWMMLKRRCLDEDYGEYQYYGGAGIKLAEEWHHDFPAFLGSVGKRPSIKHMLIRVDRTKGYEPGNVKWEIV